MAALDAECDTLAAGNFEYVFDVFFIIQVTAYCAILIYSVIAFVVQRCGCYFRVLLETSYDVVSVAWVVARTGECDLYFSWLVIRKVYGGCAECSA